jgi:hypothetical protein
MCSMFVAPQVTRPAAATAARWRQLAVQVRRGFGQGRGAYRCRRVAAQFTRFCQANGIRTSTGRTGVCWDNAAAESFSGALKNEMCYRQPFPGRAQARFAAAGLHRGRLQQATAAPSPRLPHAPGSTHTVPGRSNRCMIKNPGNCPRS